MWTGFALIQPGWALFRGTAGDHARHRHHAVQIVIGLEAPVALWAQAPGTVAAPGAVIAADCPHQLAHGPEAVLLLYLERESGPGRALDDWCAGQARALSPAQNRQLRALLDPPATVDAVTLDAVVAAIAGPAPVRTRTAFSDARIAQSIAALPRPLPENLTVSALAAQARISVSRYSHLFRAHTGMSLRPYLRWLRLQQALAEVARGANLTAAAHSAGFADSAHLSRSFRRTFGIAPGILRQPALSLKTGGA